MRIERAASSSEASHGRTRHGRRGLVRGVALVAALIAAAAAATTSVPAYMDSPEEEGMAPPGPDGPRGDDLRETIEIYMLAKMKTELNLSHDQEEQIVPLVQSLSAARQKFRRDRRQALDSLRPLVNDPSTGDAAFIEGLKNLDQAERSFHAEEQATMEKIRAALSPRQQAQFFLFMERFMVEMQHRLRMMQGGGPPGRGDGPRRRGGRAPGGAPPSP